MPGRAVVRMPVTPRRARLHGKEANHMIPLLLWILGVPGLIIILLLLLGVIKL
jgi:hypothetical protein